MALKEETRTVDGQRYHFTQLPFKDARKLWVLLVKRLGPTVGQLLSGQSLSQALDQDVDIGGAIAQFASQLTDDDLDYVTQQLAKHCLFEHGGNWPRLSDEIDTQFGGSLMHWLNWMRAGLEVNYGDFFGALQSVKSEAKPPKSEAASTESG